MNDLVIMERIETGDNLPFRRCGIIDFAGEIPDGNIILIDFTRRARDKDKDLQLAQQTRGLMELFKRHNGESQFPQISQYLGKFETDQDQKSTIVKLLPRSHRYVLPPENVIFEEEKAA